jgi:hypothetical protein
MWEETCVYIYSAYGRAALLDQSRTNGCQTVVRRSNTAYDGDDLLSTQGSREAKSLPSDWPHLELYSANARFESRHGSQLAPAWYAPVHPTNGGTVFPLRRAAPLQILSSPLSTTRHCPRRNIVSGIDHLNISISLTYV